MQVKMSLFLLPLLKKMLPVIILPFPIQSHNGTITHCSFYRFPLPNLTPNVAFSEKNNPKKCINLSLQSYFKSESLLSLA